MSTGKLESDHFRSVLTDDVLRIAEVIGSAKRPDNGQSHEVRLVGGAVRDLLMDKKPKDVDLATTMLPEDMFALCESSGFRTIATGLKHGTITVVTEEGQHVEITTLRVDEETDGRHATVKYTADWRLDAARRDLTINALSLGLDGTLYDYFSGEQDIHDRRVRFVGDPVQRIEEDYLRILRYFRFHGRIAADPAVHEEVTLSAIRRLKDGLRRISVERVRSEICALLCGRNAPGEIKVMYDLQLAELTGLPLPGNLAELERVWLAQRESGRDMVPMTMLVALHGPKQGSMLPFTEHWKLSRAERALLLFVAGNRACDGDLKFYKDMLTHVKPASKDHVLALLVYQGRLGLANEILAWKIPAMPLNGHVLKQRGFQPGGEIAVLLTRLRKEWQASNFTMSADELLKGVGGTPPGDGGK